MKPPPGDIRCWRLLCATDAEIEAEADRWCAAIDERDRAAYRAGWVEGRREERDHATAAVPGLRDLVHLAVGKVKP